MFVHLFFILVHILCIIFGFVGLLISIPLHIIVTIMRGHRKKLNEQTELLKEQNELLKKNTSEKKEPKL